MQSEGKVSVKPISNHGSLHKDFICCGGYLRTAGYRERDFGFKKPGLSSGPKREICVTLSCLTMDRVLIEALLWNRTNKIYILLTVVLQSAVFKEVQEGGWYNSAQVRTMGDNGVSPSLRTGDTSIPVEIDRRGQILPSPTFSLDSGPRRIAWCSLILERAVCFTHSCKHWSHLETPPRTHPDTMLSHACLHPVNHSGRRIERTHRQAASPLLSSAPPTLMRKVGESLVICCMTQGTQTGAPQ